MLEVAGASSYGKQGYLSLLHTVYLLAIRPYVHRGRTRVLEIGPGRGAWTKAILSRDPGSACASSAP